MRCPRRVEAKHRQTAKDEEKHNIPHDMGVRNEQDIVAVMLPNMMRSTSTWDCLRDKV